MGEQEGEDGAGGEAFLLPVAREYFRSCAEGEGGAVGNRGEAAEDGERGVLGYGHKCVIIIHGRGCMGMMLIRR
jgi:hypothetical protein